MKPTYPLKITLLIAGVVIVAFLIGLIYLLGVKSDQKYFDELEEALENPDRAEILVMRNRKMKTLPPEIGKLHNLKVLNIGNNNLKFLPAEIGQLKNLEELSVEDNELTYLPKEILKLSRLRTLNLNNNKLTSFPTVATCFPTVAYSLEEIYLGGNAITEVPLQIRNLRRLKVIDLAENHIESISVKVTFPDSIRKIDLYHNNLKSAGPLLFLLPALKELILEENPMDDETLDLYDKFKKKQFQ